MCVLYNHFTKLSTLWRIFMNLRQATPCRVRCRLSVPVSHLPSIILPNGLALGWPFNSLIIVRSYVFIMCVLYNHFTKLSTFEPTIPGFLCGYCFPTDVVTVKAAFVL